MTLSLPVIELAGAPAEMGRQFGEHCRDEVRELYERRLDSAVRFAAAYGQRRFGADQVLALAEQCLPIARTYDPRGYAEFAGIAQGADLTEAQLFVMQGLTDLRDVLAFGDETPADGEGCSSMILPPHRTRSGRQLLAQNWDLETYNMAYITLVRRTPDVGPATVSLTLTGCLTLIGLSAAGLAVGNTNLRTSDGHRGVQYLHVLHRAINETDFDAALAAIRDAPRLSGHYYYIGGPHGQAAGLECSATQCVVREPDGHGVLACNHALTAEICRHEKSNPADSTHVRQSRLEQLLAAHPEPLDIDDIKRMLSDHERDEQGQAICRHSDPPADISTNACVILDPQAGQLHACRGQPHLGQWRTEAV